MQAEVELDVRQTLTSFVADTISPPFLVYASLPEYFSKVDAVRKMVTDDAVARVVRIGLLTFEDSSVGDFGCDDNPNLRFTYNLRLVVGNYGAVTADLSEPSALRELSLHCGAIIKEAAKIDLTFNVPGFTYFELLELPTIRRLDTGTDDRTGLLGAFADITFQVDVWQ